ncbi:MAG: RDD family protein [Acidobacteria bacterium]|nr:RDD family protein [Acidobacteriota bacterium]
MPIAWRFPRRSRRRPRAAGSSRRRSTSRFSAASTSGCAGGMQALPIVPLVTFLLLLDAGYTITFTAAVGQTIGKMATGIKVVDNDSDSQPPFGFAVLRTAAYAASLLPAGLGFLPALLGKDRRALHDRLAETRVIYGVRS